MATLHCAWGEGRGNAAGRFDSHPRQYPYSPISRTRIDGGSLERLDPKAYTLADVPDSDILDP